MIAVSDNPRSDMVCLFKTLRGYIGGSVEPVDFHSGTEQHTLDASLAALGHRRAEDWRPVPGQPGAVFARVTAEPDEERLAKLVADAVQVELEREQQQ